MNYFTFLMTTLWVASGFLAKSQSIIDDYLTNPPTFTTIATSSDGISFPRDLDFNKVSGKETELWVVNRGGSNGANIVILFNAGMADQTSAIRHDSHSAHFLIYPTSISMSDNGNFGTVHEIKNTSSDQNSTFMGPALWSSDTAIFARINQNNWVPGQLLGSHLDMLHQSPFAMGIEHEADNIYWVFDGYNGNICRYDFALPHIIGGDDHSDGKIWRYTDVPVTRVTNVPNHLALDKANNQLFIVDGGSDRVIKMDITSGIPLSPLVPYGESLAYYWSMQNTIWSNYISTGLDNPSGIAYADGRLIVTDYANGDIIIYNTTGINPVEMGRINTNEFGITGISIGPDGLLYFVNYIRHKVVRIDPQYNVFSPSIDGNGKADITIFPNPSDGKVIVAIEGEPANISSSLTVFNILGMPVVEMFNLTDKTIEIDLTTQTAGLYFIEIKTGQYITSKRVIIEKF